MPRELFDYFGGRVGLFHTQPADQLLDAADLVVTIGYNPVEYEPGLWNQERSRQLVHIDAVGADVDRDYRPAVELIGDVAATLRALAVQLGRKPSPLTSASVELLREIARDRAQFAERAAAMNGVPIHPMRVVYELQRALNIQSSIYGILEMPCEARRHRYPLPE